MRGWHTLLVLLLTTFACGQKPKRPGGTAVPFLHTIQTPADFDRLKGPPLSAEHAAVDAVKVVYELRTGKLYFINNSLSRFHYNFCERYLGYSADLFYFNQDNYSSSGRRQYLLGNVNHYRSAGLYTLEFSPADDISATHIALLHRSVSAAFLPGARVHVYGSSPTIAQRAKSIPGLPVITPDSLYAAQTVQIVQPGTACGTLRYVEGKDLRKTPIGAGDILFIHGPSADLPLCAGVLTDVFQTPLSHTVVLAHNRGTPLAVHRAVPHALLQKLTGTPVCLTVQADTFFLQPSSAATPGLSTRPPAVRLRADGSVQRLVPLREVTLADVPRYGSKACYLAELARVRGAGKDFRTPKGSFVIPFHYYRAHLARSSAARMAAALCADTVLHSDGPRLAAALKALRDTIKTTPMDPALLRAVQAMIIQEGTGGRARFRSSSNAEDLPAFNGAGLYDSKTGDSADPTRRVEQAIKSVWASVWNEGAFRERAHYGIAHEDVVMAVIVQESFPDEWANGVAITRNLYRADAPAGMVISMQPGEASVVQPEEGTTAELAISYFNTGFQFYNSKEAVEYISYSSLAGGKPVLSTAEMAGLTRQLDAVKKHFFYKTRVAGGADYESFALDIEFKVLKEGGKTVWLIKQARPYR